MGPGSVRIADDILAQPLPGRPIRTQSMSLEPSHGQPAGGESDAGARIMLVSQSPALREEAWRALGQRYELVPFADGAAALQAALAEPFDLLLVDSLALERGPEGLLPALRARDLPVILLAPQEDAAAERAALAAGADAFLGAPFTPRELLTYVRAHLALGRGRREAERREQELGAAAALVKERLEHILEGINDDFVMYDDDWRYVYVNEQAARSLGFPREELIGRRIWDLFPGAVGNLFYQEMTRAKAERRDVAFEHHYEPWGMWIENRAYVMPNGMLLFSTDITERKRAEAALRESEQRFRSMADNAPVMIWVTEPDGAASYLSKSWYEFTGQTPARGLGFGWFMAVHPDDRPNAERTFMGANERRESFRIEYRLRRWDGVYRWAIDAAAPRFGASGEFLGYIGSVIDISERKQAEEALRLGEERLRLTLRSADIGTWDFNPLTDELTWDARCKALFGLPPEANVTYEVFLAGLHPADRERADEAVQDALDPTGDGQFAIEYRTIGLADGVERWIAANGQGLFEEGRAVRFIGTVRDITERRRGEAERAQQLEQERVLRAEAEEASRLKDEFLATVSHELRTPLTAFLGYAQLLQRRTRDEAYVARTVEKLVRSAQDQAQIIEDLLDVSRIVSGKLRLEMAPADLLAVVAAALDTARPAIEAKEQELFVDLGPRPVTVLGDANRLQQVAWNLLSNATKFTPPGGRIEVRLEPRGREAVLSVSDTGQGISASFLPYAFDRFRQADSTSRRRQGGLGLGLAIVRQIVELHGGTVQAASAGEGLGATFTVRLPLTPDAALPRPAHAEPGAAERYPVELDGLRVLLVDDQPDILDMLQEVLAPCGAVVRSCAGAREALGVLRAWRPDVLVSDIAMPDEDGYWLIRQLRALPPEEGGDTPAAALTAYVRVEERVRVLAAGFQLYVPKPVEPGELRNVVARLARAAAPD
jgi:PAS domain S-box-containing protein